MDERLKFIGRLLDGENMAALCRQFGISRKTGYKILKRYRHCGLQGLTDRSRRPAIQNKLAGEAQIHTGGALLTAMEQRGRRGWGKCGVC